MPTTPSIHDGDLNAAVQVAVHAPSLHNSQPWLWRTLSDGLELHADRGRQIVDTDPDGHGLVVSCGAALELARIALTAAGYDTEVAILPDPAAPDLLARLRVIGRLETQAAQTERVQAALRRRTDRFPFDPRPVPEALIDRLVAAVDSDEVWLHHVHDPAELVDLTVLASRADDAEQRDPAYRAELAYWTHQAEETSGVPAGAIPHVPADLARETAVVVRDFEVGTRGERTTTPGPVERPAVLALLTTDDSERSWLLGGQALMRVLLEAELAGLSAQPFTQPVDWPGRRSQLRAVMDWVTYPQFLLRVGYPGHAAATSPTPRRAVDEVLLPEG
jgi:hypothetical protein